MAALVDHYLERYPAGKHVPELLLRKSYTAQRHADDVIESLLNVPRESATYRSARERAALLLYKEFRSARGEQRRARAEQFLDVQQPLLAGELDEVMQASAGTQTDEAIAARDRLLTRCRQVLDAATAAEVRRLDAALEAMSIIDRLVESSSAMPPSLVNEFDCRRVQIELLSGRVAAACSVADALWSRDQSSPWAQLATRAVFRDLLLGRQSADLARLDTETLELISRYGGRVIQEFTGQDNALAGQDTMTYHVIVAEASFELWRRSQNDERAGAALFLFERLLEARPDDGRFLRATAELAGTLEKHERALQCWRTLLAGLPPGSNAWFEAKYHQIDVLAKVDRDRALEVLDQHIQLEGGYGPEPWGPRLRELDETLRGGGAAE
jgi:hypothetical protein